MTSPVPASTDQGPKAAVAAPPRKRRRRTGGNGAGDDCFACSKRAVKCDRKRPYCTQCIDNGKECSGYKTTLTWGVGVASRGKLRGLSYPVAGKSAIGSNGSPPQTESRRRKSSVSVKKEPFVDGSAARTAKAHIPASTSPTPADLSSYGSEMSQTRPIEVPQPRNGWHDPFSHRSNSLRIDTSNHAVNGQPYPRHLHTSLPSPFSTGQMSQSATSVQSYAETEYGTPLEYPPSSFQFGNQYTSSGQQNTFDQIAFTTSVDNGSLYGASNMPPNPFGSDVSSLHGDMRSLEDNMTVSQSGLSPMQSLHFRSNDTLSESFSDFQFAYEQLNEEEANNESKSLTLVNAGFGNPFSHLPGRLQSLIDCYDRNICPFLVAFDGPQNPYRMHVLQLATRNECLQNAIAALATNNLRMRTKTPRQIGFVEEITDAFGGSEMEVDSGPTPEETMYKQISIDQLNLQLASPGAAQDDSVLATLLILCLFHVCDSGFSKFKTQLAGMQKLLSLRSTTNKSGFERWVEMFFTWFDVMTSTVNDREVQIKGESLDMLDFSANLGPLEEFSGCDGRLFKLIARLGRLNLLAQGRPVRAQAASQPTAPPSSYAPRMARRSTGRKPKPSAKIKANRSLSVRDYENIDGNGWGTPIISTDEDADGSADEVPDHEQNVDQREEFWSEWYDIRARLQTWQMDVSSFPDMSSDNALDAPTLGADQQDFVHISEAFRFAALLYTERLGQPTLPSSSSNFRDLVAMALYHITALPVTSCVNKFLLWPLFIAGTECVDEGHRNVIRTRCIEVQRESGFYNNLSALEVLERVWKEVGNSATGGEAGEVKGRRKDSRAQEDGRYGQAFRWRKAMDRVDGEYILI